MGLDWDFTFDFLLHLHENEESGGRARQQFSSVLFGQFVTTTHAVGVGFGLTCSWRSKVLAARVPRRSPCSWVAAPPSLPARQRR